MPASGRLLLDANIVIAILEGEDVVLSNLDLASEVFVSAVVVGELFFGAAKSGRPAENRTKVERFADGRSILPCDLNVARAYGRVGSVFGKKGDQYPKTASGSPQPRCVTNWFWSPATATSLTWMT